VSERATMSVEAPGAKATNKVTGLALGQSLWAEALTHTTAAKAATVRDLNAGVNFCNSFMVVSCLLSFFFSKLFKYVHPSQASAAASVISLA